MSDDTPTRVLPTAPPSRPRMSRPSRAPMIAFIVLAIVLVAALGVLAAILVNRVNDPVAAPGESPAATPTATHPSVSPSPILTPQPPGAFTSFEAATIGECQGHGKRQFASEVRVTWATTDATAVWVAPGSDDAVTAGEQVPLSGNQDSFSTPLRLDCQNPTSTFTMTLIGDDGTHVSRTWVVTTGRHHHGDGLFGDLGITF